MRLNRTLFYILLGMLVAGILAVVLVDKASVVSSIGVGLMTGAIVGLVSCADERITAFFKALHDRGRFQRDATNTE